MKNRLISQRRHLQMPDMEKRSGSRVHTAHREHLLAPSFVECSMSLELQIHTVPARPIKLGFDDICSLQGVTS